MKKGLVGVYGQSVSEILRTSATLNSIVFNLFGR